MILGTIGDDVGDGFLVVTWTGTLVGGVNDEVSNTSWSMLGVNVGLTVVVLLKDLNDKMLCLTSLGLDRISGQQNPSLPPGRSQTNPTALDLLARAQAHRDLGLQVQSWARVEAARERNTALETQHMVTGEY